MIKKHKLGVIVPYRNRLNHLVKFTPHMSSFLNGIPHEIIIVEQDDNKPFNRAKLLNIGYHHTKKNCDYFSFHDIDLLPIGNADYSYNENPTHLAQKLDFLGWRTFYEGYFGGVTLFNKEDFEKINGFSNNYWGWGGEDDDLILRCKKENLKIGKRPNKYKSLPHPKNGPNHTDYQNNIKILKEFNTIKPTYYKMDGLNSLEYTIIISKLEENYILLKVKL